MNKKKVSIIMNCHNGEKFLEQSINSVISQSYENWEIIFFDNCSTDKSKNICLKFNDKRIRYFKSKKMIKLGLARKIALSKAVGDFIAFLDVDDLWKKNKLNHQLKYLKKKEVGFSISNSIFFNKENSKYFYDEKKKFKKRVFNDLIKNYFISFDTVIIKKEFLNKLDHNIDERFNVIHDMDLLIRLSRECEMSYVPLALSKWRMTVESDSYNKFKQIINEKKIFIKKISKKYKKNENFINSKIKFMDILYRQEILFFLSKRKFLKVLKLIPKLKINYKNIILILIIFLPFKKYIYNKILNLKY